MFFSLAHRTGPKPAHSSPLWVAAALVSLVATAFHLRHSLTHGALALPPTYDDVSYLLDGARYLNLLDTEGLAGILRTYLAAPPHAPISTGAALVGFSLFGFHNWVGAATNAVLLFLFSRLFLHAVRDLPLFQSTCLLLVLWTSPFIGLTLWWFRPDMFASLAIAAGSVFILTREHWTVDRRAWMVAGCALGAALWAKPVIFPLTLALFGAAIAFTSIRPLLRGEIGSVIRAGAVTVGIGLLLASPNYLLNISAIVGYIRDIVFGREADIWVRPLPLWESATFYLTGYYGKISLGWWIYAAPAVGLACIFLLAGRRDRSGLAAAARLGAFVAISYVAVTVPTFKGPHGYPFAAALLVVTILAGAALLRRVTRPVGAALAVAAVLLSLASFQWPFTVAQHYVTEEEARLRHELVDEMLLAFGDDIDGKQVLFSTSTMYTNAHVLEFALRERGQALPDWVVLHRTTDFAEHIAALETADIVVAYSPEAQAVIPNLPTASAEARSSFIAAVEDSNLFDAPTVIPDRVDDGSVLIFTRSASARNVQIGDDVGTASPFVPVAKFAQSYELAKPSITRRGNTLVVSLPFRRLDVPTPNETIFFHLLDKDDNIVSQLGRPVCDGCDQPGDVDAWIERFTIPEDMQVGVVSAGIGIYDPVNETTPLAITGKVHTDWEGHRIRLDLVEAAAVHE